MDEEKKKKVMIGVIVVCLLVAGVIFLTTGGSGNSYRPGKKGPVTMLCTNCEHIYTMTRDDLVEEVTSKGLLGPQPMTPKLTCPECSEDAAIMAFQCKECETAFPRGTSLQDYSDRCPECGYSEMEEKRKAAK